MQMSTFVVSPANDHRIFSTALRAAWSAILLGFVVQALVFLAKFGAGAKLPPAQMWVDVASGISWSTIVCGGVAIGSAAHRMRASTMGTLGFLFGPAAFAAAKAVQRSVGPLLGVSPDVIGPVMYETAAAKALEYALLGLLLGAVIGSPRSTLKLHTLIGAAFGVVFSGVIAAITILNQPAGKPIEAPKLAGTLTNELIFPVGCSLVLFWVSRISQRSAVKPAVAELRG
jgi:hypothetical protein